MTGFPFDPALTPPATAGREQWFCVFGDAVRVLDQRPVGADDVQFLGMAGEVACWAVDEGADASDASDAGGAGRAGGAGARSSSASSDDADDSHRPLMTLYQSLGEPAWALAGRAVQLVNWARTHRFCGRCGSRTERAAEDRAMVCPACRLRAYPRLAPAAIVVVERPGAILLARNKNFPIRMFSALAGFVEPGETVEHTVVREVREEVGVDVDDVRYVASQPWPFPHSLMLGFRARWAGGDIVVDPSEIAEAAWFDIDDLPPIPPPISIARRLIDEAVERQRRERLAD